MKRLIIDIDDTISQTLDGDYLNSLPHLPIIEKLHEYKQKGFEIGGVNTSKLAVFQKFIQT